MYVGSCIYVYRIISSIIRLKYWNTIMCSNMLYIFKHKSVHKYIGIVRYNNWITYLYAKIHCVKRDFTSFRGLVWIGNLSMSSCSYTAHFHVITLGRISMVSNYNVSWNTSKSWEYIQIMKILYSCGPLSLEMSQVIVIARKNLALGSSLATDETWMWWLKIHLLRLAHPNATLHFNPQHTSHLHFKT